MKVWKYGPLVPGYAFTVEMPHGAKVRHFGEMGGLWLWAEVNPTAVAETRTFMAVGTGWEVEPGLRYHGTAIDGEFVWHLFEVRPQCTGEHRWGYDVHDKTCLDCGVVVRYPLAPPVEQAR